MNYTPLGNLQTKPLLTKTFHSIHIDLRDTSNEKIPFVSVGIIQFVLMLKTACVIHFQITRSYKIFASRQLEIILFRGFSRQCGRELGALGQVFGKTAISFLPQFNIAAAKRVGIDLLEFAAPKFEGIVSSRKNFRMIAMIVGRKTLRKQLSSVSRKGKPAIGKQQKCKTIPVESAKQSSCSRNETFTNNSQ